MILIGADIQSISEFAAASHLREPGGCFTDGELAHGARARAGPLASLAGLFAAKEAFFKALPERPPCYWDEVELIHSTNGSPRYRFSGAIAAWMAAHGLRAAASISHSGDSALAVAWLESGA